MPRLNAIDIAVGVAFSLLSLSLISAMNPYVPAQDIAQLSADDMARAAIDSYLQVHGLSFLASASFSEICASAPEAGADVIGFSVDGTECPGDPPAHYLGQAGVDLKLPGRDVMLDSWYVAEV